MTAQLAGMNWPDGLDEAGFRQRYWQRKPLLMRQALPGFVAPIDANELAGLALEPDANSRLVERIDGAYHLEHGPFDEERLTSLPTTGWSLLVTDMDKLMPELAEPIAPFRAVAPDWRFDDLMISIAPDGASVGAHVDEYDVFLLQASGRRRWSIDTRPDAEHVQSAAGDLRLIEDFAPTDRWTLDPGDALYLPPGIAHHGVALGDDCMTWSIGFRAPSEAELVRAIAEAIAERIDAAGPARRLTDSGEGGDGDATLETSTTDRGMTTWREAVALDDASLRAIVSGVLAGERD